MIAFLQQWNKCLTHPPGAERIRVERLDHRIEDHALRSLIGVIEDRRVVNEYIQLPEPVRDDLLCIIDAFVL